jgi:hypothetical protein
MKLKVFLLGLTTLTLGGCIDSDYDLSNIDTTSEFKVEDLTLPINIDAITLSNIFDLSESSKVQVVNIDGKEYYAIVSDGTFRPDPIKVDIFTAPAPVINSTHEVISHDNAYSSTAASQTLTYSIVRDEQPFTYKFSGIHKAVYSAKSATTRNFYMKVSVNLSSIASTAESITVKDLVINLPKGLTATPDKGSYDKNSGRLTIAELPLSNGKGYINLDISSIDFELNGSVLDYDSHTLTMNSSIDLISGSVVAKEKANATLPTSTDLYVDYDLSDITATAFSGQVKYDIEGININPIHLSDIPKFLSQDGTEIFLTNPQIYLKMHNMVADNKLSFTTGLRFTANRSGVPSVSFTPDANINVGYDKGSGPYNFVLSPSIPTSPVADFASGLSHISFTSLSDLLGGTNGIPSSINVEAINPQVPIQYVENFKLGVSYASEMDSYRFFAPLSLKTESIIIYTDTYDGWNDEDVDAITINKLSVSANVTSTLPMGADIIAYPIDKYGNVINNVQIDGGQIPAEASDYELNLTASGVITHLDGVKIEARVKAGSNDILAPQQTITLKNVKAKVSGNYTKEL